MPESNLIPPNPSNLARAAAWGATFAVAAGLVSGCEPRSGLPNHDQPSVDALAGLPYGPCDRWSEGREGKAREVAQSCREALGHGTVALVSFDAPKEVVDATATAMPKLLSAASGGLVKLTVTKAPANPAAKKALADSVGSRKCIDSNDPTKFASVVADRNMPELRASQFVIALTNYPACDAADGTSAQNHLRHADVFDVDNRTPDLAAKAATHEGGHLYGLGHTGSYVGQGPAGKGDLGAAGYHLGDQLDLERYLRGGDYRQYGPGLMGDIKALGSNLPAPNQLDVNALRWSDGVLQGQNALPAKPLTKGGITFGPDAVSSGQYAMIELKAPVTLTDKKNGAVRFDRLNIVPAGQNGRVNRVNVVLSNDQNVTAILGPLAPEGQGSAATTISFAGQRITVATDGAQVTVNAA